PAAGGTALAMAEARRRGKPLLVIDLAAPEGSAATAAEFRAWAERWQIRTLNVAGPRESEQPGIHALAAGLLRRLMAPPAENP
ncbi:MAG: putative molybdenum carrier protein, partial [bacterium]